MASQPAEPQGLVRPQIEHAAPTQPAQNGLLLPAPETETKAEVGVAHHGSTPITPHGYLSFFAVVALAAVALAIISASGMIFFRKFFYNRAVQNRTNTINAGIIAKQKGDVSKQDNSAKAASARLLQDQKSRRKIPEPDLTAHKQERSSRPSTARHIREEGRRLAEADESVPEEGAFSEEDFVRKAAPVKSKAAAAPRIGREPSKATTSKETESNPQSKPVAKRAPRKTQTRKAPSTQPTPRSRSAKKD